MNILKLSCKIIANSSQNKIVFDKNANLYKIYTSQKPIDGKANKAIIEFLSSFFSIPKYNVILERGINSTLKIFKLLFLEKEESFIIKILNTIPHI